jgi:hypothetical protein
MLGLQHGSTNRPVIMRHVHTQVPCSITDRTGSSIGLPTPRKTLTCTCICNVVPLPTTNIHSCYRRIGYPLLSLYFNKLHSILVSTLYAMFSWVIYKFLLYLLLELILLVLNGSISFSKTVLRASDQGEGSIAFAKGYGK